MFFNKYTSKIKSFRYLIIPSRTARPDKIHFMKKRYSSIFFGRIAQ